MRVVCISDTHGRHRDLIMPEGDVLVHAGDITHFGKEHQLEDFNQWLGELPYNSIVVVAGNHECNNVYNVGKKLSNAVYLDSTSVEIQGYTFFGIKYYPDAYPTTIPPCTNVVVSHNPPRGIGDAGENIKSGTGCPGLLMDILKRQPKLHVFGHVHTGHGVYGPLPSFPNTTFVNAAICGGKYGYGVVNSPTVIDI